MAIVAFSGYSSVAHGALAGFVAAVLVVVSATDLERRIIPNRVILPAIGIVLAARVALSPSQTVEWLLAALGAGLVFLVPNMINHAAMGMGDVKLGLFLGASLGVAVVGALLAAFLSVFPFAIGMLIRGGTAARKATLPFGPFLAFGGLLILIVPRLVGLGGS
jgi:leader peptidase (prepilin peptidase)/N-methyltransferase